MKANENTDIELDFLIARGTQDDYPTFLPEFREEFSAGIPNVVKNIGMEPKLKF